jgi:hypothetical protein
MIALLLLFLPQAFAAGCEHSPEALVRYERAVLNAKTAAEMAPPLACILDIHEKSEGMTRYFAASALRPLLGAGQIAGVMTDVRYKRVAKALEILTLKSKNPLYQSVIAEFARGDWRFYELFCAKGDTQFCADFMPDGESLKKESPLLAAASLVRLKNAYHSLSGKEREEIGNRIKKLYRDIPVAQKLQRKFIDQIYRELFAPPALSQA